MPDSPEGAPQAQEPDPMIREIAPNDRRSRRRAEQESQPRARRRGPEKERPPAADLKESEGLITIPRATRGEVKRYINGFVKKLGPAENKDNSDYLRALLRRYGPAFDHGERTDPRELIRYLKGRAEHKARQALGFDRKVTGGAQRRSRDDFMQLNVWLQEIGDSGVSLSEVKENEERRAREREERQREENREHEGGEPYETTLVDRNGFERRALVRRVEGKTVLESWLGEPTSKVGPIYRRYQTGDNQLPRAHFRGEPPSSGYTPPPPGPSRGPEPPPRGSEPQSPREPERPSGGREAETPPRETRREERIAETYRPGAHVSFIGPDGNRIEGTVAEPLPPPPTGGASSERREAEPESQQGLYRNIEGDLIRGLNQPIPHEIRFRVGDASFERYLTQLELPGGARITRCQVEHTEEDCKTVMGEIIVPIKFGAKGRIGFFWVLRNDRYGALITTGLDLSTKNPLLKRQIGKIEDQISELPRVLINDVVAQVRNNRPLRVKIDGGKFTFIDVPEWDFSVMTLETTEGRHLRGDTLIFSDGEEQFGSEEEARSHLREHHSSAVKKALAEGTLTPAQAEVLGHFDNYPELREDSREQTAPETAAEEPAESGQQATENGETPEATQTENFPLMRPEEFADRQMELNPGVFNRQDWIDEHERNVSRELWKARTDKREPRVFRGWQTYYSGLANEFPEFAGGGAKEEPTPPEEQT